MAHPAPRSGALLTALLISLAAACRDAPDSALPTEVDAARTGVLATCTQGTIRSRIDLLYPAGPPRTQAHQAFNQAIKDDGAGFAGEADLGFTGLAAGTVARRERGELLPAASSQNAPVDDLVRRLYACADIPVPDFAALLPPDVSPMHDIAIGAGVPGLPFEVVTPSGNFSVSGGGDFLDGPAVFVVFRLTDEEGRAYRQFTAYPPAYRVRVSPYDAQANYDDGARLDGVEGAPWARVTVCPGDPHHHPLSDLQVLRREDPIVGYRSTFIPRTEPATIGCSALPPYSLAAVGSSTDHSLGGRLATLWSRAVHGAGDLLTAAFVPPPLHAVDGGIGGRAELLSDFVAARPWVRPG